LDTLWGRFIESPAAQKSALYAAEVDTWPDIRDPVVLRDLEDDGFTVISTPDAFLYYHIDCNLRDQIGNGTHTPCSPAAPGEPDTWANLYRGPDGDNASHRESMYYQYYGAPQMGYAPLDDTAFRQALALCIPKDEIVAVVYGGISGAPVDSCVPEAQRAWYKSPEPSWDYNPGVPGEQTAGDGTAVGTLMAAGYVWNATAPNPASDPYGLAPEGNWMDPRTGEPMNHIEFAGVTQAIAPDSWGRDDLCARDWRAIGLPIEHEEVDYSRLTDTMMDYYEYDMYALGWGVTRFPDHLYSFFHTDNNFVPEGYNIMGSENPELDEVLEILQFSLNVTEVREACFEAQDIINTECYSIPTVTRPLFFAARADGDLSGATEDVKGIVNVPGFGADTDATYTHLYWETGPIGGSLNNIVPSKPTNYHPAFASTTDEWLVMQEVVEGLVGIDPYTHTDIPYLAQNWTGPILTNVTITDEYVGHSDGNASNSLTWLLDYIPIIEDSDTIYLDDVSTTAYTLNYTTGELTFDTVPANCTDITADYITSGGMNNTFWLRQDVVYHDGAEFNASVCEFSLEWLKDMQIGRAQAMWQHLDDVVVNNASCFSAIHKKASLWLFYDIAGWAAYFPPHIYEGTTKDFRPEEVQNPLNTDLTCLVGTGPFVFREAVMELGGYVKLTAFRDDDGAGAGTTPSPVGTDHWWQTVESYENDLTVQFHWTGDGTSDGVIDVYDLSKAGKAFGTELGDTLYDADADTDPEPTYHENDDRVDMRDIAELSKNWGKQRHYP
jgi:ABC-type transport system substrate-binding protein